MFKFKKGYYADIRIEYKTITDIAYRMGTLMDIVERKTKGAFIRLYDGTMWYYASTSSIEKIQEELDNLYSLATYNENILQDEVVKKFEVNKDTTYIFKNNSTADIKKETKNELLKSYFPYLSGYEEIKMWFGKYVDRHSDYEFYSSLGAELKYDFQTCGLAFYFALADGSNVFQGGWDNGETDFEKLKHCQDDLKNSITESIEFFKNAESVTPGEYEVVFSPVASGVFAHESFGHKSEADLMMGDESAKKEWALGAKVGSDILSIVDEGDMVSSGYIPYDDEGTKSKKIHLIKNGILSGRLHSSSTAVAFGDEITGNARALNTEFEPIVRMRSTYIDKGTSTFEELIKSVKHGYYVKTISHGSGMTQFTIAPIISYEIVDGKITKPVKISVVTGNVFETLGLITGVANDLKILSFVLGGCGKMEQYPLSVGIGGPHIKVSKMKVQ